MRCWLIILLMTAGGCTTTLIPPPEPHNPVTVFITNYGKHSSLIMPDPRGGLVEYAFGDYDWFALGKTNAIVAIHAMIWSPKSALGRRWIYVSPDAEDVKRAIGARAIESVTVDADRVAELQRELDAAFERHIDQLFYSRCADLSFVPGEQRYDALHNCNTETGEWLRDLGVGVKGLALFSGFRVEGSGHGG